jgi:predicted transcriptional regulator of viral defense system
MPTSYVNKANRLFEIANRQQGYFTAAQALECGYYASHFHRRVNIGDWVRKGHGIYRLVHYPFSDRPDVMECSLWSRNKQGEIQGVWSHDTALDFYDVCDVMPSKLHMTVPKHFRRSAPTPPVLVLHVADLQPSDCIQWPGQVYRLTTFLRTLLDLAETFREDLLEQAIVAARKKGMFTEEMRQALPDNKAGAFLKNLYDWVCSPKFRPSR